MSSTSASPLTHSNAPTWERYFDHNATSPFTVAHWERVAKEVFTHAHQLGNPSSPHAAGRRAQNLLNQSRRRLSEHLGCDPGRVVFMASATEANNTVAAHFANKSSPQQLIYNRCAHPSAREPLQTIAQITETTLTGVSPTKNQREYAQQIVRQISPHTKLLFLMSANNETGQLYPVKELGDFLHRTRFPPSQQDGDGEDPWQLRRFLQEGVGPDQLRELHFHVDATQSFGKCPAAEWTSPGIDSFCLSGHKVGALPGSAALVVTRGKKLSPLLHGGAQERSRRAGTENIPAIVSLGLRAEELTHAEHWEWVEQTRQQTLQLERDLRELMPEHGATLLSHAEKSQGLANTLHFLLNPETTGFFADDLLIELDLRGIAASSGSACSSGSNRPSEVVLAHGFSETEALNAVRLSFGPGWSPKGLQDLRQCFREFFGKNER